MGIETLMRIPWQAGKGSGLLLWCLLAAACEGSGTAPTPAASPVPTPSATDKAVRVQDGMVVTFHYQLTVDGQLLDDSRKRASITYLQGGGQLVPGLERQLIGLRTGETHHVTVEANEGYTPPHPLQGKRLHYEVQVLEIREPGDGSDTVPQPAP